MSVGPSQRTPASAAVARDLPQKSASSRNPLFDEAAGGPGSTGPRRVIVNVASSAESNAWRDRRTWGGILVSLGLHGVILLLLALIVIQFPGDPEVFSLKIETGTGSDGTVESLVLIDLPQMETNMLPTDVVAPPLASPELTQPGPSGSLGTD